MKESTKSDAELRKELGHQRSLLLRIQERRGKKELHEWTIGKIREQIEYLESQLALPRMQRVKYSVGSL